MANNVQVGFTFATQSGPIPLNELDTNFSALQAAINSMNSYTNYLVDTSGAANVITVTLPANETGTYVAGLGLQIQVANTTTITTPTINLSSLGAKSIINADGSALVAGQIVATQFIDVIYDGVSFRLMSQGGSSAAASGFKSLVVGPPTAGTALTVNELAAGGVPSASFIGPGTVPLSIQELTAPPTSVLNAFIGIATAAFTGGTGINGDLVLCARSTQACAIDFCTGNGAQVVRMQIDGSGNINVPVAPGSSTLAPIYSTTPPRVVSGAVTPNLADNGKYLDCAASTAITLPLNSSVAYPIGAIIGILADFGSGTMTVAAGAGDTLFMGGSIGTTGTRTIAPIGWASLLRLSTTQWVINGSGVT